MDRTPAALRKAAPSPLTGISSIESPENDPLPRQLTGPRKRRTREHIIAEMGVNHVERVILERGYSLERVVHDYGIDALLFTYDRHGETDNIYIPVHPAEAYFVFGTTLGQGCERWDFGSSLDGCRRGFVADTPTPCNEPVTNRATNQLRIVQRTSYESCNERKTTCIRVAWLRIEVELNA